MGIVSAKSSTGHDLPAHVMPDGSLRMLGAIPSRPAIEAARPWLASGNPVIPRSDWKPFNRRRTSLAIWDQGQEGSCVAHGILRAYIKSLLDSGQATPMLARAMLYALINGGRDAGADPADAITALQTYGVCTEATVPYRFLVQSQIPSAAFTEAKRWVLPEGGAYACADFDEAVSAAILGFHLGVTVYVAGDWNTLDANGCPPAYRGSGNHEMNGGDALTQSSAGDWLLELDQSWGPIWGNAGRCNIREAHFANQPGLQIFAFKYAGMDPQDPNLVPPAPV